MMRLVAIRLAQTTLYLLFRFITDIDRIFKCREHNYTCRFEFIQAYLLVNTSKPFSSFTLLFMNDL